METDCRCGHPVNSLYPHPCHMPGCDKPATKFKVGPHDSWGCEEHKAEALVQWEKASACFNAQSPSLPPGISA